MAAGRALAADLQDFSRKTGTILSNDGSRVPTRRELPLNYVQARQLDDLLRDTQPVQRRSSIPVEPGDASLLLTPLKVMPRIEGHPRRNPCTQRPPKHYVPNERHVFHWVSRESDETPSRRIGHRCAVSSYEMPSPPLPEWGEEPSGFLSPHPRPLASSAKHLPALL